MARSFADKLDRLFNEIHKPDGSSYSLADVATAITAQGDVKLSGSYLSELRSGRKDNPNMWVASALARFFGQPLEYFVEDMDPVQPGPRRLSVLPEDALDTLEGRLAILVRLAEPHGVTNPTDEQLARWMEQAGSGVDARVLASIRSGEANELASEVASSLASYFQVPTAFLTDPAVARAMAPQLRLMGVMRDQDVRRIALRANSLDASDRERVADLIKRLGGSTTNEELDF